MRDETECRRMLSAVQKRHAVLVAYRNECIRIDDHHGVQDAASDLREAEAVEHTLHWILGTIQQLDY